MTPTMEDVAGLLREAADNHRIRASFAGTASGALMHRAKEKVYRDIAAQVEAMGWRPIEEAPKNGTYIDLWDSSVKKRLTDCRWDGNNRWVRWDENAFGVMAWCVVKGKITHFMAIPQPPGKE